MFTTMGKCQTVFAIIIKTFPFGNVNTTFKDIFISTVGNMYSEIKIIDEVIKEKHYFYIKPA